ncbi:MAG: hypothetical protein ABIN58_07520, partial [candidate division WOR-3 bacterium]
MKVPKHVVEAGWSAKEGASIVDNFKVAKRGRVLVVRPNITRACGYYAVVAFTRPEDRNIFEKASQELESGGPAYVNPGAVGTLEISIGSSANPPRVELMQAHFITSGQRRIRTQRGHFTTTAVPRKIATQYGGWRTRCIEEALEMTKEHGGVLSIPKVLTNDQI